MPCGGLLGAALAAIIKALTLGGLILGGGLIGTILAGGAYVGAALTLRVIHATIKIGARLVVALNTHKPAAIGAIWYNLVNVHKKTFYQEVIKKSV
jgi:hypothetical protein